MSGAGVAASAAPTSPDCRIDPNLVRPWRDFHRMRQKQAPYARVYRGCGKRLIYVAAVHGYGPDSSTYRTVRAAFAHGPIDFVIAEGFPEQFGVSPARMVDYAKRVAGGREDAEPYLSIRLATAAGAAFSGGEPSDTDVLRIVKTEGMSTEDLFGFYVVRQIEQWEREGRISGPNDPGLDTQIKRFAPIFERDAGVSAPEVSTVATADGWKAWYRAVNGVAYATSYRHEDAYPSSPGSTRATNRMSDKVADARDHYIIGVIDRALRIHDNVLVVYGASHNVVEGPALDAAFGGSRDLEATRSTGLHTVS
jgi:hypothetical protein